MRDMKGSARGLGFQYDGADADPFAELADIFEAELGRDAFRSRDLPPRPEDGRTQDASTALVRRAPPLASDPATDDLTALDAHFDTVFVDALSVAMVEIPGNSDARHERAADRSPALGDLSHQSWILPRDGRTPPGGDRVSGSPEAVSSVALRPYDIAGNLPPTSELERAIRGLSAPANPRDVIIVETQSFAPERVVDELPEEQHVPAWDEFDELIASELAAMNGYRQGQMHAGAHGTDQGQPGPTFAATGGSVEAGDPSGAFDAYDEEPHQMPAATRRRLPRRTLGALGFGVMSLALVGAIGVFAWNGTGADGVVAEAGDPLLIKADAEPYKIAPKDPGGRAIPNQNKAVYERVAAPGIETLPTQQALLTDAEEPIDLPDEGESATYENLPGVDLLDDKGFDVKDEERVAESAPAETDTSPVPVLQPRKVRTMVVRPDGTMVAAGPTPAAPRRPAPAADSPATVNGAPALIDVSSAPVPRRDGAATTSYAAGLAAEAGQTPPETAMRAAEKPLTAPQVPVDAQVGIPLQVADPLQVAALGAPPAAERSAAGPADDATPMAPVAKSAAPAPAATLPKGGYFVQISSQPSEALAQASLQSLSGRYADVIEGRSVGIQSADIPGKGMFYRVRVATASKDEASALCSRLKSAGGNCFVAR